MDLIRQLVQGLDGQKAIQQEEAKVEKLPASFRPVLDTVGDLALEYLIDAIVGGQQQEQAKLQATTPESFINLCYQMALKMTEGLELSMMELCRFCMQVCEALMEAGKGMSADEFNEFCCKVAKEVMKTTGPAANVQNTAMAIKQMLGR